MLRRVLLSAVAVCAFTTGLALAQPVPVDGEVIRIDQAAGKMTLKHGPIANLDMEA